MSSDEKRNCLYYFGLFRFSGGMGVLPPLILNNFQQSMDHVHWYAHKTGNSLRFLIDRLIVSQAHINLFVFGFQGSNGKLQSLSKDYSFRVSILNHNLFIQFSHG